MKSKTNPKIARASYEKGILTLDLPRATQPMLWRQEIRNISTSLFWVAAQDNGTYALIMRLGTKGEDQIIAYFTETEIAEISLSAIREIFITYKKKHGFWGILFRILFLIFMLGLISFTYHLADTLAAAGAIQHEVANAPAERSTSAFTPTPPTAPIPSIPLDSSAPSTPTPPAESPAPAPKAP